MDDNDIVFREEPRPADIRSVRELTTGTGFFRPDEVAVAAELVEERLAKGVSSDYYFWFADINDKLVGYVCYGPIPCTISSYDLYWIAVDAGMQGRGLGRRLIAMAEASAREMGGKRMYVETGGKALYQPTRAFYERTDYFRAAEFPEFYDVGDAKIVYQKNLA